MKDRIVFDVADADTIAASDSIGAYVRASDGTLVTHTTVGLTERLDVASALFDGVGTALTSTDNGGKQSLDVNVTSAISVTVDGVYDVGTNPTPDSVGAIFHVRGAVPAVADQTFRVTGGAASADNVVAANVQGLDTNSFLMGYDGATWDRVTATAGALDINLKTSAATVTVSDAALANTAMTNAAVAVDTTAGGVALAASVLSNRKYLLVQNLGSKAIYVGTGTVTAVNGFRLSPSSGMELRAGAAIAAKSIAESGTQDVRILQLS